MFGDDTNSYQLEMEYNQWKNISWVKIEIT